MVQIPEEAKKGDSEAFFDLIQSYRPLIDSLVSQYGGTGNEDEEDMRQEAMIALYSAFSSYDHRQTQVSFGLYAKICIRNRLVSYLRKKNGEPEWEQAEISETVAPEVTDPEQRLLDRESYRSLIRTIDASLTDLEKKVLGLYLQDATYAQIAQTLGVSEKTVDNAIYRLKAKLKKRL